MQSSVTYSEILQLDSRVSNPSPKEIKAAFHAALLRHHPDKVSPTVSTLSVKPITGRQLGHQYSVDQIIEAYQALIDPARKEEFDLNARQNGLVTLSGEAQTVIHTGFEVYDLDKLDYNEDNHLWQRFCRCGDATSYVIGENDLEHAGSEGEIYVSCAGCSLFIKVLFDIADDQGPEIDQADST